MSPTANNDPNVLPDEIDLELLEELELQDLRSIPKLRKHSRMEVSVPVVLRPGNLSATEPELHGTSRDIAPGGCVVHFPRPVGVGDVFRISFDDASAIPSVYARSLRCLLLGDDRFVVAFSFICPINLDHLKQDASEPLDD